MKNYEFEGETFTVDDSKGCYVEVTHKGEVAYLGVNLHDGTEGTPFRYAGSWETQSDPDGLTWGYAAHTYEQGMDGVCRHLLNRQSQIKFDRERACKELHEETAKLP